MKGAIPPLPFQKGDTGVVSFHKSIASNFMACQDQLDTYSLQLLTHPQNSEWFSIIYVIIF